MPEEAKPALSARRAALCAEVTEYATAHYEDGGWDVVVETMTPAELSGFLGSHVSTLKGAIKKLADVVSVWADREADAQFYATESYCGFQGERTWCCFPPKHEEDVHSDGTPVGKRDSEGYAR